MPITKVPEVGKVLVRRAASTAAYPWYEPGGKIVRIAGQRVYYQDKEGVERFTHEYACVTDTQEEAAELLNFTETQKAALTAFMDGIAEVDKSLQQRLSDAKPKAHTRGVRVGSVKAAEPAPTTTSRVRRTR